MILSIWSGTLIKVSQMLAKKEKKFTVVVLKWLMKFIEFSRVYNLQKGSKFITYSN